MHNRWLSSFDFQELKALNHEQSTVLHFYLVLLDSCMSWQVFFQKKIKILHSLLKIMSVLVYTLPITSSEGIANITKQFRWYVRAFTFSGCSQFNDCCRVHCVDFVY